MKSFCWERDGRNCWAENESKNEEDNQIVIETEIEGGNFSHAGQGSSKLKSALKKLGVDHSFVKRSAVSAYEAEMNVVIHAERGKVISKISGKKVRTEVRDQGKGIEDIEKALVPGFSTASEEIREMGFGAGLGLPNIKKNADRLFIETEEGRGTKIEITICLG